MMESKGLSSLFKLGTLALCLGGCASNAQSTLDPEGPAAAQVAFLWWVMFAVAAAVCLLVLALMIIALIRNRGRRAEEIDYRPNVGQRFIIVGGILFPGVVLVALMGLIVYTSQTIAAAATPAVTVEIVGHQWWWEVRYPDEEVVTANEIHIPANQPVTLRVTTDDVIHSFWIPQLYGKIDLIPGQINTIQVQADEPGIYRGQCAEFCGVQHAKMSFLVIAEPPEQFAAWLEQQRQPAPEPADPLVQRGQQIFLGAACVYCHAIRGTNASGRMGPDLTHLASRETIGAGILENNRGNLAGWIIDSQEIKPGNRMPLMYLSADELQALLAYMETLE
jgi:cytochrome c oxidase subunit II